MPGKPGDPVNAVYYAISSQDRSGEGYAASYTSVMTALNANAGDLVTANETHIYECFPDFGSGGLVETTYITDLGAIYTTSESAFFWFRPIVGAEVFNPNNTILDFTTHFGLLSTANHIFSLPPLACRFSDMYMRPKREAVRFSKGAITERCFVENSDGAQRMLSGSYSSGSYTNCVYVRRNGASTGNEMVYLDRQVAAKLYISNCLFINAIPLTQRSLVRTINAPTNIRMENVCVAEIGGGAVNVCYVIDDSDVFNNNAGTDASASAVAGQTNSIDNFVLTDEIVDWVNNDFHLKDGSQFIGSGINLQTLFQNDFEEDARPTDGSAWCRGPDEVVSGVQPTPSSALFFGQDF